MLTIINITQIIVSLLLIIGILMQQRGGGLSSVFGGEGSVYRTRRGIEKTVFIATIILAILFLVTAFLNIFLRA
ncbi:MAG: preprotein translocase subunit SecG [Candidatus Sungbacteria bacterium]|nr:preprotein translocase subunit SecG [bacterium]MDZ4260597.1 preprotein translocase subunit SecG [Candidatus Sungbacteria bacterium]